MSTETPTPTTPEPLVSDVAIERFAGDPATAQAVSKYAFGECVGRARGMANARDLYEADRRSGLSRIAELEAQVKALQAFKDYVHQRLDQAGIPTHPPGEHTDAGCRVGQRLDVWEAQLGAMRVAAQVGVDALATCVEYGKYQTERDYDDELVPAALSKYATIGITPTT